MRFFKETSRSSSPRLKPRWASRNRSRKSTRSSAISRRRGRPFGNATFLGGSDEKRVRTIARERNDSWARRSGPADSARRVDEKTPIELHAAISILQQHLADRPQLYST